MSVRNSSPSLTFAFPLNDLISESFDKAHVMSLRLTVAAVILADSLKWTSALSVALAVVFVVIVAGVTMWKLVAGDIPWPRLTPEVHDQKSFWRLFTVIPVIMTAYICHHNGITISHTLSSPLPLVHSFALPVVCRSFEMCAG